MKSSQSKPSLRRRPQIAAQQEPAPPQRATGGEIPEDLFRKDFGGQAFVRAREEQLEEKRKGLTYMGLLMLILGPAVLGALAWIIAKMMAWNGMVKL